MLTIVGLRHRGPERTIAVIRPESGVYRPSSADRPSEQLSLLVPTSSEAPIPARAYRARRRIDRRSGIWFTHALVRAFSTDLMPLSAARGLGLAAFGCMPPARDFLARRMTFGSHI